MTNEHSSDPEFTVLLKSQWQNVLRLGNLAYLLTRIKAVVMSYDKEFNTIKITTLIY